MSSSPFPPFPVSQITIPSNPLLETAYAFVKEHCAEWILNHCVRSTAFALIAARKLPPLAQVDTEAIVLSILLHDMGWATTKSLTSKDKRFEVDGANIARNFINSLEAKSEHWNKGRVQMLWDAIALHTTPSIAFHKEPEVMAVSLGITMDFFGPHLPIQEGSPLTVEEYKEIVTAYPRSGFKDELKVLLCGICRDKPETTFDNFVSNYGKMYYHGTGSNRSTNDWTTLDEDS